VEEPASQILRLAGSSTAHTSDNKQLRSPGGRPSTLDLAGDDPAVRARTEPTGTILVTVQNTMLATQVPSPIGP
jgi:hypothetical protein